MFAQRWNQSASWKSVY